MTHKSFIVCLSGNADGGGSRGDSIAELVDLGRLVVASQSALVVLALLGIVVGDVLVVHHGQFVDGAQDLVDAALLAHRIRREVRVAAGSVPVALQIQHFLELLPFWDHPT